MNSKFALVSLASIVLALMIIPAQAKQPGHGLSPLQPPYPAPLASVDNSLSMLSKPTTSRLKLDGKLEFDDIAFTIADAQTTFYATHGFYWHAPSPVSTIPEPGRPVGVNRHVSHRRMPSWDEIGIDLPQTLDFDVYVRSYHGPRGRGYCIVGQTQIDGVVLRRSINYGPETWMGHGWITVTTRMP